MIDVALTEHAHHLVESSGWEELLKPMIEESIQDTLSSAINSMDLQELARCQGWKACLEWILHEVDVLATEYKENNPDA